MAKIDLSKISHSYNPNDPNPVYALNPFSMTWENGNRYAILGPSGCGKTTMLNIVSGLVITKPDTMFSIVVFPHPEGPKIAYRFPFSHVIEKGFKA